MGRNYHRRRWLAWAIGAGVAILSGGCATVATGATQSVEITSDPSGAECLLTRPNEQLGKVTTPGSIKVSRSAQPIKVTCSKQGYQSSSVFMSARHELASSLGNFVSGRSIGALIDQQSGADSRYASSTMLWLAPLPPPDKSADTAPAGSVKKF